MAWLAFGLCLLVAAIILLPASASHAAFRGVRGQYNRRRGTLAAAVAFKARNGVPLSERESLFLDQHILRHPGGAVARYHGETTRNVHLPGPDSKSIEG